MVLSGDPSSSGAHEHVFQESLLAKDKKFAPNSFFFVAVCLKFFGKQNRDSFHLIKPAPKPPRFIHLPSVRLLSSNALL